MNEYGDDITREQAVHILLDMLRELREADLVGNEDKGVALMMGITALACISTEKLYELAPQCWITPDTEELS